MANAISSSETKRSHGGPLVQKIVATFDTGNSAVSQAMLLDHEPDEFWAVCTSDGGAGSTTDLEVTFDTANGEVDLTIQVEGSGTVGHTYTVFLKWYDQAEQDGSSIGP